MDPTPFLESINQEKIDKFIDKISKEVVKRHLTAPAIVLLESSKPFSFVGSQAMIVLTPMMQLFVSTGEDYYVFQKILASRDHLERLIVAIEKCEEENLKEKGE